MIRDTFTVELVASQDQLRETMKKERSQKAWSRGWCWLPDSSRPRRSGNRRGNVGDPSEEKRRQPRGQEMVSERLPQHRSGHRLAGAALIIGESLDAGRKTF